MRFLPSLYRPFRAPRRTRRVSRRPLHVERLEERLQPSSTWVEQGPGPFLGSSSPSLPGQNDPAAGAVEAIAVDPTDAAVVYLGTVNGGVWKTTNYTSSNPTWAPLTDTQLPSLSINSVAVSPVDHNVVYAGTGSTSSDAFLGSPGFGIAKSSDGGATWTVLAADTFAGRRIRSVVPTTLDGGNVVLAATLFDGGGVWRSTDGGADFTRLSGAAGSGLPDAGVSDLVADPSNPNRFYAAVPVAYSNDGNAGVFRSDDGGQTWAAVNSGLGGIDSSLRILLSVHGSDTNTVYAMVIASDGSLSGVFRSADQGASWQAMGTPTSPVFPGQQGIIHGAIAADPNDANVVFISGDTEFPPFPNAEGADRFSGNLWRGVYSTASTAWQNGTFDGAQGTAPHADSRALAFDPSGNLLQGGDGGIYRVDSPDDASLRHWESVNSNLRSIEFHSVAYDPLSKVILGGTQDNGTPLQPTQGSTTWFELQGGDGGAVAVDADQAAHPGTTTRYTSSQFFGDFNRSTWDAGNNLLGDTLVGLNIVAGPGAGQNLFDYDASIQFYQPFVLNTINPSRMLIGTRTLYESFNQGDSLTNLNFTNGSFVGGSPTFCFGYGAPMVYGGHLGQTANPDVIWAGEGNQVLYREHLGQALQAVSGYQGGNVETIVADPHNYKSIYVVDDNNQVWSSQNAGKSFKNLTANLGQLTPSVWTIELLSSSSPGQNVLVAGGLNGVFQVPAPGVGHTWSRLGSNLPNALVQDLHYYASDNLLLVGTLGRGAWTLADPLHPSTAASPNATGGAGQPASALLSAGWHLPFAPVADEVFMPAFLMGMDWYGRGMASATAPATAPAGTPETAPFGAAPVQVAASRSDTMPAVAQAVDEFFLILGHRTKTGLSPDGVQVDFE
jgi:hypothetical protein